VNRRSQWIILILASLIWISGCSSSNGGNSTPVQGSITATSGTPQSAAVSTAFGAPLVATVKDSGGNPVSGVLVTFTPPATGASATFAGGANTAMTNASGVATSATITANGTAGGPYTVMAAVAGVATAANFTLTNTAATATGTRFSFYLSGLEAIGNDAPSFYVLAGAVTIDPTSGAVTGGEQDYNDAIGITSPQPSGDAITGGALTVDSTTGQGTLTLVTNNANLGVNGTETLGVQFVNANHALIVQFDGSATSSGSMDLQTLPSTLSGGFSFNLSGVDPSYSTIVAGGVFTISGTTLSNGIFDVDDTGSGTVALGTPFTGSVSAPDSFGRGTISNSGIGGISTIVINYYIVGSEAIRIIDVDTLDAAVGSAFGQGTGAFSNASLGSFVFGIESNSWAGPLYAATGMLTTSPGPGTFQGVGDLDEEGVLSTAVTIAPTGTTYSIGGNGYGSLTIPAGAFGDVSLIGIYMTDPNLNLNDPNNTSRGLGGALIANLDAITVGTGILVPQTDTSTASFAGNYAFGAQDFVVPPVPGGWEFDFVGQGSVVGGVLSGTGLVSDPFKSFGGSLTDSNVTFKGTATPDVANVGRYTMATNPLAITVTGGTPKDFNMVLYQTSGGQFFWMEEDASSLSLGFLQQQSTSPPFPAAGNLKSSE
jgi:hypothetical protein